jgi:hypothetical protein
MTFRYVMQLESEYFNWDEYNVPDPSNSEYFLEYYAFNDRSDYDQTLALVYFSFTTLTTVGFGDYNPRSNGERLFIAFGLLFGVMIFAVILGNYQGILDEMKKFYDTADDSGELSRFFTVLQRYNDYKAMRPELKTSIEIYFEHRWEVHKNGLLYEGEYASYLNQLPDEIVDNLLYRYLYTEFL